MPNLTNITAVFATANDAFNPITHKPNDADLQRLNKVLVVCRLFATLTGTDTGCPSGVVLIDTVYCTSHSFSFNFMYAARVKYIPVILLIADDITRVAKTRVMEHEWTAGTRNQRRIQCNQGGGA